MNTQCNPSQMQLLDLLIEITKQNTQVIQQNNQLIQQIAVQSTQINELLLILEQQQDEENIPEYMDD